MNITHPAILLFPALILAAEHTVLPDIEFTRPAGLSIKLDAHIPPGKGPFPAVVLVHGGGWTNGTKTADFIQPLFPVLDQGGFAWFSIDYRLAPAYPYPAELEDVEAAVRFVKQHAKEYKVDPKRIALMGESAGGHLVNLVGARNKVGVAAVVCFYGPIDMVLWSKRFDGKPLPKALTDFFKITALDDAGLKALREASADIYLNKKTPPFLVIHGTKDEAVLFDQAVRHVELFKKLGIPCELITIQDGVHGVINWEKDPRFTIYKAPMIAWLHKTLGK